MRNDSIERRPRRSRSWRGGWRRSPSSSWSRPAPGRPIRPGQVFPGSRSGAWPARTHGRFDDARRELDLALELSLAGGSAHCLGMVLNGAAALALAEGDADRAGLLAGAAEGLRRRAALRVWAAMRGDDELTGSVRTAVGAGRFDELFTSGARLSRSELLERLREGLTASALVEAGEPPATGPEARSPFRRTASGNGSSAEQII